MSLIRSIPLFALLALLCACGGPASSPSALPAGPPYITGAITANEQGEIRVEADPGQSYGSDKAMLRLAPGTVILWRTGERADQGDLRLGTVVSVWVGGPIMESYPVQATADTLVIQSTTRPASPQA